MEELFSSERIAVPTRRTGVLDYLRGLHQHAEFRFDDPIKPRVIQHGAVIGGLVVARSDTSAMRGAVTKGSEHDDKVGLQIVEKGSLRLDLHGRTSILGAGDMVVLDGSVPSFARAPDDLRTLSFVLPKKRLEALLGPTRLYSARPLFGSQGGASLARTFLQELVRVHGTLDASTQERMMEIGLDLILACVSESMARETPISVQGTATVQRAKAYVETNLHDPALDPRTVALAVGVSLRRLQQLFHERGRHISDWIWSRRIERAAQQLTDRGCGHLTIVTIAYGLGFTSQSHFSNRFREAFGVTPSEYRRDAIAARFE